METEQAPKKPKKKSFLAPLKAKDGSKSNIEPNFQHPKKKENTCDLNKCGSGDDGNQELLNSGNKLKVKKDGANLKEPKKVKKVETSAPAKSLTDAEYDDLFNSVLQRVVVDDENGNDNDVHKESKRGKEDNEAVPNEKSNEISNEPRKRGDNDVDSIASEDVDTWADSPCNVVVSEQSADPQPALKPKSVLQKKAERKGTLKPKQLFLQDAHNSNGSIDDNPQKEKKAFDTKHPTLKDKENIGVNLDKTDINKKETENKGLKDEIKKKKKKKKERDSVKFEIDKSSNEGQSQNDSDEEKGTWIQCSKKECGKWRYVDGIEDPIHVPAMWECSMNPDEKHNACDLPEVDFDESEHICTKFTIGSLVWAKMDGYPWWPGMIEADPDYDTYFELLTEKSMNPFQYHVTFFDDHVTRAWIKTSFISPYIKGQEQEHKVSKGRNSYRKEIQHAIANADKAEGLSLQKRINTFGFLQRYKKNSAKAKDQSRCKPGKQHVKENKTEEMTKSWCLTESHSSEDFSDMNDSAEMLEDSEYKPVGTKSRAIKITQEKEEIQSSEDKTSQRDDTPEENDSESDPYMCEEKDSDTPTVARAELDPDVFTMELESSHKGDKKDCGQGTKLDSDVFTMELESSNRHHNDDKGKSLVSKQSNQDQCKSVTHENTSSDGKCKKKKGVASLSIGGDKEKNKKNSKTKPTLKNKPADSAVSEEKFKVPSDPTKDMEKEMPFDDKSCSDSDNKTNAAIDNSDIDKTSGNKTEIKKKKKSKLALKSSSIEEEKVEASELAGEESDKNINSTKISTSEDKDDKECDDSTVNFSKKEKPKKKLKTKQIDKNTLANKGTIEECENDHKDSVLNKKEESNSQAETNIENSYIFESKKKVSKEVCLKSKIEESSEKNGKEKITKNKCKKAKTAQSNGDSDKENLDPSINVAGKGEKNKKAIKRKDLSLSETSGNIETKKAKNSKQSLSSEDKNKAALTSKVKSTESNQDKESQSSKKKFKNFSAPVKVCKSSDREVPELTPPSNKGIPKDKVTDRGKPSKGSKSNKNNDQHIVPDMSQESALETHEDMDMEHAMFDEIKKSTDATLKPCEGKLKNTNVNVNDDSEEEELDLNIDIQKVGFNLPHKILNDSDESDDDDVEPMDCDSTGTSKVVVEKVENSMQTFGRFAGRCTDHGSDSDPMELIED